MLLLTGCKKKILGKTYSYQLWYSIGSQVAEYDKNIQFKRINKFSYTNIKYISQNTIQEYTSKENKKNHIKLRWTMYKNKNQVPIFLLLFVPVILSIKVVLFIHAPD